MGNLAATELAQLTSPEPLTKTGLFRVLVSKKNLISILFQQEETSNNGDTLNLEFQGKGCKFTLLGCSFDTSHLFSYQFP